MSKLLYFLTNPIIILFIGLQKLYHWFSGEPSELLFWWPFSFKFWWILTRIKEIPKRSRELHRRPFIKIFSTRTNSFTLSLLRCWWQWNVVSFGNENNEVNSSIHDYCWEEQKKNSQFESLSIWSTWNITCWSVSRQNNSGEKWR